MSNITSHFAASKFLPQNLEAFNASPTPSPFKVDCFYLDSSGSVQVLLPLELEFASRKALDEVIRSKCVTPGPSNWRAIDDNESDGASCTKNNTVSFSLAIEARVKLTFGASEAVAVTVENATIESSSISNIKDNALFLYVACNLRVSKQGDIASSVAGVKLNMEVAAVLTERRNTAVGEPSETPNNSTELERERQALANGLHALQSGPQHRLKLPHTVSCVTKTNALHVTTETKLAAPVSCQVNILHAISVSARTMHGPSMGESWIALEIAHSNFHSSAITIDNVVVHPAFSTVEKVVDPVADITVENIDMSQNVQWRFLLGPEQFSSYNNQFPKTLQTHEALSIVLHVTAEEEDMCRTFSCPVSISTSVAGDTIGKSGDVIRIETVIPILWTSSRRAVESSNGFRVDFLLPKPETIAVGEIFALNISVLNMGEERKDLKLCVLRKQATSIILTNSEESKTANIGSGVQFEKTDMPDFVLGNGSGDETNGNQLLAVDDSFALGTLRRDEQTTAQIRFMPLRTGTLPLPFFDILTLKQKEGKEAQSAKKDQSTEFISVYRCLHNLQVLCVRGQS